MIALTTILLLLIISTLIVAMGIRVQKDRQVVQRYNAGYPQKEAEEIEKKIARKKIISRYESIKTLPGLFGHDFTQSIPLFLGTYLFSLPLSINRVNISKSILYIDDYLAKASEPLVALFSKTHKFSNQALLELYTEIRFVCLLFLQEMVLISGLVRQIEITDKRYTFSLDLTDLEKNKPIASFLINYLCGQTTPIADTVLIHNVTNLQAFCDCLNPSFILAAERTLSSDTNIETTLPIAKKQCQTSFKDLNSAYDDFNKDFQAQFKHST